MKKRRKNGESWADLATQYYSLHPPLLPLRENILSSVNDVLSREGSNTFFDDVWVLPEASYRGTLGSTIITNDGKIVLRVTVMRSKQAVADTILHEAAHAILGKKHIRALSHGEDFAQAYHRMREYQALVEESL